MLLLPLKMFVTKRLHTICRLTRCVTKNVLLKNTPYVSSKPNSALLLQVNFLSSHNLKDATNTQEENETGKLFVFFKVSFLVFMIFRRMFRGEK